MTTDLQHMSKSDLAHQVTRLKGWVKARKAEMKQAGMTGLTTVAAAAGGITAGVIAVKQPESWRPYRVDAIAGAVLVGLAAADVFDNETASHFAASYGNGLIAAAAARETQTALLAQQNAA